MAAIFSFIFKCAPTLKKNVDDDDNEKRQN